MFITVDCKNWNSHLKRNKNTKKKMLQNLLKRPTLFIIMKNNIPIAASVNNLPASPLQELTSFCLVVIAHKVVVPSE